MILKETDFTGGIQLIGLGIPVIGLMEFFSMHPGKKLILKRLEACNNGKDCELYLRYLTYMIHHRDELKNSI